MMIDTFLKIIGLTCIITLLIVFILDLTDNKDETIAQLRIEHNNALKDIQDLEYRLQYCQMLHKGN